MNFYYNFFGGLHLKGLLPYTEKSTAQEFLSELALLVERGMTVATLEEFILPENSKEINYFLNNFLSLYKHNQSFEHFVIVEKIDFYKNCSRCNENDTICFFGFHILQQREENESILSSVELDDKKTSIKIEELTNYLSYMIESKIYQAIQDEDLIGLFAEHSPVED